MAKKAKTPTTTTPTTLRRRMVLVSETDLQSMRTAFAAGTTATVTVHPTEKRDLTDEQRLRRKAYRQRPEVRAKQKAYRAARAQKVREALRAVNPAEIVIVDTQ
jgi:hypothetical protein